MSEPTLTSIQVGLPRTLHDEDGGEWRSAYVKEPVWDPLWLRETGLDGDGVGDTEHHGGPEMAVCVYAGDHCAAWREELPHLAIGPGAFGENFTVAGLTEETACVGDVFEVGEALVQISKPRAPCFKIGKRWGQPDFTKRVHRSRRTGWYLRVLREGTVEARSPLTRVERLCPEWTVRRVYEVWTSKDSEARDALAACEALDPRWREALLG